MSFRVTNINFDRYKRSDLADLLVEKISSLIEIVSNFPQETLFTIEIDNLIRRIEAILENNPFETTYEFIFIIDCKKLIEEATECEEIFRIHVENNKHVLPTLTFVD
jgi:hypothetical protein